MLHTHAWLLFYIYTECLIFFSFSRVGVVLMGQENQDVAFFNNENFLFFLSGDETGKQSVALSKSFWHVIVMIGTFSFCVCVCVCVCVLYCSFICLFYFYSFLALPVLCFSSVQSHVSEV